MAYLELLAFDADDTLWHNEKFYVQVQEKFTGLLAQYHSPEWIQQRLYQTEMRNLEHFGYGVKAFTLSMIETAIELTEGRISGDQILLLIEQAKQMLANQVELLPNTVQTIRQLAENYALMIITKGDLLDQETKLARSGLQSYFRYIEIVSHKTAQTYRHLLQRNSVSANRFLMVGNSLKSDILPVLEIGSYAVHIPCSLTWLHEKADPPPEGNPLFFQLEDIGLLPGLIQRLEEQAG